MSTPITSSVIGVIQSWAEDTFAEFREHGLVDNVEEINHMNTNPNQGRTIWDLLRTVMTSAQAASIRAHMKNQGYDITRNKYYPVVPLEKGLKKLCPEDNTFQTIRTKGSFGICPANLSSPMTSSVIGLDKFAGQMPKLPFVGFFHNANLQTIECRRQNSLLWWVHLFNAHNIT